MTFNFNNAGWIFEENGKLHFKQVQLFQLHRLMLCILGETGLKLRYATPKELRLLLEFAERSNSAGIQTQLSAVLAKLPANWQALKKVS